MNSLNYDITVRQVFDRINDIRQNPIKYSVNLEKFKSFYRKNDFMIEKNSVLPTQEGVTALEVLISFMEKQKVKNKFKLEKALNLVCENFCKEVKNSNDLNELMNTYNFQVQANKLGKIGSGRILSLMTNLISKDLETNIFLTLLCDGDESRQYRDYLLDSLIAKIGIHIHKYPNEDSPIIVFLLLDEYKPSAAYENDEESTIPIVQATEKLNLGKNNERIQGDNDDDFELPPGVAKIEKKSKLVKEGNKEYIITRTIMHMEDGSVNTDIVKTQK